MKHLLVIFLVICSFNIYAQDKKKNEENLDKNGWTKFWDKIDKDYGWGNEVGKKKVTKNNDKDWWSDFWNKIDGVLSSDANPKKEIEVDDSPREKISDKSDEKIGKKAEPSQTKKE